ncbi:hypothetical protein U9M48_012579 [Paspalum notatum var. saurae]|uniref:Transposase n=1 Tax=Paspalum notatum var. saurae TaxID=547442 RepID=A0AAQ3SYR7_PASNO
MPPNGDSSASDSASKSKLAKRYFFLEPPPRPVNSSPSAPTPTLGTKRPGPASASSGGQHDLGVCVSAKDASATPTHCSAPSLSATNSEGVPGEHARDGVAISVPSDGGSGSDVGGNGTQVQAERGSGQQGSDAQNPVLIAGEEHMQGQDEDTQPSGKRAKKCTSDVWQYFTKKKVIIEDKGKTYLQVWAHCDFPNCKHKGRAESNYGTTGFWTHLRTTHSIVKGQQQLKVEKDHGTDITAVEPYRYDEQASLKKFYLAIVMHEYPFNISDHEYFIEFIKSLRPSFPIKSRVTVRNEIMSMYLEEKDKLYNYFKNVDCRFSTTMDMWTSNQNKSYMCVTAHWVDDNWCIQKRILNFFHVEGRHTGAKLAETFTEVMVKWYVEKRLFALTLDNASANEVAVRDIITDLNVNGNASLVCDGIFFHVRCACHILNLVARDGLSIIAPTIDNIRALVLAVKGSPLQWEELMKRATECGLDTSKGLSLDVATRWNSTYLMLRDALYYKAAFMRLKSSDRRRYEKITPSPAEWGRAYKLFQCLKRFYDLTELFSGTLYPTANLFYRGFCEIKLLLDDWSTGQDATISAMAFSMNKKFDKYWKKSCTTLAVACFLDPRYKKRLIEFYMRKFHGSSYQVKVDELVAVIKKLFQFYSTSVSSKNKTENGATMPPSEIDTADLLVDNEDVELESYLYDSSGLGVDNLNELDKYMADPPLKLSEKFDILAWWKNQSKEYPILSKIARDLLAVQVSTVASESAFSAGGRVIDPFRSRLDPEMVQALICTKDWVAAARKDRRVHSIVGDLEVIEALAEKLLPEDTEVADSDGEAEVQGTHNMEFGDL